MKPVLLDTGVIVALLDRSERLHETCVECLQDLPAPLVTCEAVIAESCYLLRRVRGAADAILENVETGIFQIPIQLSQSAARLPVTVAWSRPARWKTRSVVRAPR